MWWTALALAGGGGGMAVIGHGGPPPAPPPVAPPDFGRLRLGDTRWAAGTGVRNLALSPDGARLAVSGEDGVAVFDATSGALLARPSSERATRVLFLPDGRAAWMGDSKVQVEGGAPVKGCYRPAPWALDATAAGELVFACDEELTVVAPEGVPRKLAYAGVDDLVVSPLTGEILARSRASHEAWRIPADGGKAAIVPGLLGAAFSPQGRLAAWYADRLEIDGRKVPLPEEAEPFRAAWSPDGETLAVAVPKDVVLVRKGRPACTVPGSDVVAGLAFGDVLWVGVHGSPAPMRVDPATCEVLSRPAPAPWTRLARIGDTVIVGSDGHLSSWDARTGAFLASVALVHAGIDALGPLDDARVGVVDADGHGVAAVLRAPDLAVLSEEGGGARDYRLERIDLGGGYRAPSEPVAAISPRGHAATGLGTLSVVRADGTHEVFDFTDQVHLDVAAPDSGFGAMYGDRREVSPEWDPSDVRARTLALTALAWSGDLLASAWEFQVTDAYGDNQVKRWIGVLDPAKHALAGFNVRGSVDGLAFAGDVVAWLGDTGVEGGRLPPVAPPPAPKPAPSPSAWGSTLTAFGGFSSTAVHRGAQRIALRDRFFTSRLQGRYVALALSDDGRWLAAATDRETALFKVGEPTPVWRYDLGQGGTTGLQFAGSDLWVLGQDGTALAVEVR